MGRTCIVHLRAEGAVRVRWQHRRPGMPDTGSPLTSPVSLLEARQQGSHCEGATRHFPRVGKGSWCVNCKAVLVTCLSQGLCHLFLRLRPRSACHCSDCCHRRPHAICAGELQFWKLHLRPFSSSSSPQVFVDEPSASSSPPFHLIQINFPNLS